MPNSAELCNSVRVFLLETQEYSSVLFLSSAGGPTIIIDQAAHEEVGSQSCSRIFPLVGRLVTFGGDRLHGVIPGGLEMLQLLHGPMLSRQDTNSGRFGFHRRHTEDTRKAHNPHSGLVDATGGHALGTQRPGNAAAMEVQSGQRVPMAIRVRDR